MKIAFAASLGGHLTQIERIFTKDIIGNNETILITHESERTKNIDNFGKKYFMHDPGFNPVKYIPLFFKCYKIFKKENIKLIITTGAEIGLVAMIIGKFLGLKTIFIDTIIRVKTPTLAGKFSYPFSDIFLVQNPGMEKHYGKRARYVGGII